jgi:hypothetical protein
MATIPVDTIAQLSDLRGRVLRNEPVPKEELAEALRKYREFRVVVAVASNEKKEKTAVAKKSAELPSAFLDLFNKEI